MPRERDIVWQWLTARNPRRLAVNLAALCLLIPVFGPVAWAVWS